MKKIRIIPRLDIKGPNLVKGIHLEGLRVLGKPEVFTRKYYEDGADEILYIDSVASLYGRNHLSEIVRKAAENIFIPLIVGGGVRSVEDIRGLLRSGADKIAVNTAALKNPDLIRQAAKSFGSQCVVVSIVAIRRGRGCYECLTDNAREKTGVDAIEWAKKAEALGAGELLVTSVDREGTGSGYETDLLRPICEQAKIPVIAFGGAGTSEHVLDVTRAGVDAVAAASLFHYGVLGIMQNRLGISGEGNFEFLQKKLPIDGLLRKSIRPVSIADLKEYLAQNGVHCRRAKKAEVV
ncbi:MAG: imidazole glycerol phosphate synthase subunit HisF [Candidatus Omnitrophica bacterium]|nr:imidazole glycerol phosphate synthase subunit HisF [Candidatus Omnitrophota bacterium]